MIKTINKKIKELRELHGLSIKDLSIITGLTTAYIEKIEDGELTPTAADKVIQLADALEVTPQYLINKYQVTDENRKYAIDKAAGFRYKALTEKNKKLVRDFITKLLYSELKVEEESLPSDK